MNYKRRSDGLHEQQNQYWSNALALMGSISGCIIHILVPVLGHSELPVVSNHRTWSIGIFRVVEEIFRGKVNFATPNPLNPSSPAPSSMNISQVNIHFKDIWIWMFIIISKSSDIPWIENKWLTLAWKRSFGHSAGSFFLHCAFQSEGSWLNYLQKIWTTQNQWLVACSTSRSQVNQKVLHGESITPECELMPSICTWMIFSSYSVEAVKIIN